MTTAPPGNGIVDNFSALEEMIYSGRGIIIGKTPSGNPFIGYSLTGRSPSSQARKLVVGEETKTIRTEVTDREQLERGSPALLLYPAVANVGDFMIASNGAQTKLIHNVIINGTGADSAQGIMSTAFEKPFMEYDQQGDGYINIATYEPDAPNNTPRISACMGITKGALHIIKCIDGNEEKSVYPIELKAGEGKLITTYKGGNENPLVPFQGRPLDVSIGSETADDIVNKIYTAIQGGANPGDNYAVSAAVMIRDMKTRNIETAIKNRHDP